MYELEKTVHTASSDDCNALGLVMLMLNGGLLSSHCMQVYMHGG